MEILRTRNYIKQTSFLAIRYRKNLLLQEKLLTENIFDSRLHTKKLHGFGHDSVFSFRITRTYRGIFRMDKDRIILFAIGHRKNIYDSL